MVKVKVRFTVVDLERISLARFWVEYNSYLSDTLSDEYGCLTIDQRSGHKLVYGSKALVRP